MEEVKRRKYDICHTYNLYDDLDCLYCQHYDNCDRYKQKDKKEVIERSKK